MWVELKDDSNYPGGTLRNIETGAEIIVKRNSGSGYDIIHYAGSNRKNLRKIYTVSKKEVKSELQDSEADIKEICKEEIEFAYNNIKRKLDAKPIKEICFPDIEVCENDTNDIKKINENEIGQDLVRFL